MLSTLNLQKEKSFWLLFYVSERSLIFQLTKKKDHGNQKLKKGSAQETNSILQE